MKNHIAWVAFPRSFNPTCRNQAVKTIVTILSLLVLIFSCAPRQMISKERVEEITKKRAREWTKEECRAILQASTAMKYWGTRHDYYARGEITLDPKRIFKMTFNATFLTHPTVLALARESAIDYRLSLQDYLEEVREKLEAHTGLSINEDGLLVTASGYSPNHPIIQQYTKFSFMILLENHDWPHYEPYVGDLKDRIFLENSDGDFCRVSDLTGLEHNTIITDQAFIVNFPTVAESGQDIYNSRIEFLKLSFTGFEDKPVELVYPTK